MTPQIARWRLLRPISNRGHQPSKPAEKSSGGSSNPTHPATLSRLRSFVLSARHVSREAPRLVTLGASGSESLPPSQTPSLTFGGARHQAVASLQAPPARRALSIGFTEQHERGPKRRIFGQDERSDRQCHLDLACPEAADQGELRRP